MSALRKIERATRALIAACEAMDADAIRAAVDRRGEAMSAFVAARSAGKTDERAAADRIGALAAEAEEALRAVQGRVRDELRQLQDGAQAVRGYAGDTVRAAERRRTASALDRSG